ncbi:MAG: serine/threonine-protein kinase [Planctomycetota bacterium]
MSREVWCDRCGAGPFAAHLRGTRCFCDGGALGRDWSEAGLSALLDSGGGPAETAFWERLAPRLQEVTPGQPLAGGRFGPVRRLGEGGCGAVWHYWDQQTRGPVAVKFLNLLEGLEARAHLRLARFGREAQALANLVHPHIVRFLSADLGCQPPYIVMELVDGSSLGELAEGGPLPLDGVLRVWAQVARALHFAHERGVVHRDVKPENVVLCAGQPRVVDFGLAKLPDDSGEGLTQSGVTLGTPAYMPPEQVATSRSRPVGPRSDVYGLGASLYRLVTGELPFPGASSRIELFKRILKDEPARPSALAPGLPPELDRIILTCLAKDPRARFASAEALALELEPLVARVAGATSRGAGAAPQAPRAAYVSAPCLPSEDAPAPQAARAEAARAEAARAEAARAEAARAEAARAEAARAEAARAEAGRAAGAPPFSPDATTHDGFTPHGTTLPARHITEQGGGAALVVADGPARGARFPLARDGAALALGAAELRDPDLPPLVARVAWGGVHFLVRPEPGARVFLNQRAVRGPTAVGLDDELLIGFSLLRLEPA